MTSEGLYCPLSDFHIDPQKGKVNDAVITKYIATTREKKQLHIIMQPVRY